ncbi:hypothetical protein F4809DRAFT_641667 [Biscogniauxia mediterranea]|nr:hypothetical protein F4809DRAFT_641667 [Biscogniauxia mediterranea]
MEEMYQLRQVKRKLRDGARTLEPWEQDLLWRHIDLGRDFLWPTIELLATQVTNRTPRLTYKVACWFYTRRDDKDTVARLLRERLDNEDDDDDGGGAGELMSLDEVDELMDCQILLDQLKKELQEEKDKEKDTDN